MHTFIQLWLGLLDREEFRGDNMGRGWILQGDSRIRPLWSWSILDATNMFKFIVPLKIVPINKYCKAIVKNVYFLSIFEFVVWTWLIIPFLRWRRSSCRGD